MLAIEKVVEVRFELGSVIKAMSLKRILQRPEQVVVSRGNTGAIRRVGKNFDVERLELMSRHQSRVRTRVVMQEGHSSRSWTNDLNFHRTYSVSGDSTPRL